MDLEDDYFEVARYLAIESYHDATYFEIDQRQVEEKDMTRSAMLFGMFKGQKYYWRRVKSFTENTN